MKDKIYIVFNKRGIRALTKRTKITLPVDTFMAELNLEIDDKFFANQIPKFNIKLEEGQIAKPEIEVEEQEPSPIALFFSLLEDKESENNLKNKMEVI